MTPPKVRFLRPNKVLGAQKSFLGPSKHKKLIFSKRAHPIIYPRPRTYYTNGFRTSCTGISLGHQLSKFSLRGGVCDIQKYSLLHSNCFVCRLTATPWQVSKITLISLKYNHRWHKFKKFESNEGKKKLFRKWHYKDTLID